MKEKQNGHEFGGLAPVLGDKDPTNESGAILGAGKVPRLASKLPKLAKLRVLVRRLQKEKKWTQNDFTRKRVSIFFLFHFCSEAPPGEPRQPHPVSSRLVFVERSDGEA